MNREKDGGVAVLRLARELWWEMGCGLNEVESGLNGAECLRAIVLVKNENEQINFRSAANA
jgi:hypothetical protein